MTTSESFTDPIQAENYPNWHEEKICYYVLALQESQKLLQELDPLAGLEKIKGSIHAIAATIQLMSYEVRTSDFSSRVDATIFVQLLISLPV